MKLFQISIHNYKSIEHINLELVELSDKSRTYGLIGVNEAGKSSILGAISLKDITNVSAEDFRESGENIKVSYLYEKESNDNEEISKLVLSSIGASTNTSESDQTDSTDIGDNPTTQRNEQIEQEITLLTTDIKYIEVSYEFTEANIPPDIQYDFYDSNKLKISQGKLGLILNSSITSNYFLSNSHKTILWRAESRFLISEPVNIHEFGNNPELNIPLRNCFRLAGFKENSAIKSTIDSLNNNPSKIKQLQEKLGRIVTGHIKKVWTDHPIEITFIIHSDTISFLVDDLETSSEDELSKSASQRSDGFKQFISFLLTISAENANEELRNTILLLDEPETHLHPKAQQLLLNELVNLTKNDRNNYVLFATHSNFLIDKTILDRNIKVLKKLNNTTCERINLEGSTYLSVNYEVFDIVSEDYHSELYSTLHLKFIEDFPDENHGQRNFDTRYFKQLKKLDQDYPEKDKQNCVTLCTYVRNYIQHKAECGYKVGEEEIRESINVMRSFLKQSTT